MALEEATRAGFFPGAVGVAGIGLGQQDLPQVVGADLEAGMVKIALFPSVVASTRSCRSGWRLTVMSR